MKLRKRKKNNILFIFILIVINTFFILDYIGEKITPYLELMVEKYVNKSIYNYVFNIFERDILADDAMMDLIDLTMNNQGEVIAVDYKFNLVYEYLSDGMENLYNNIHELELDFNIYKGDNSIFFVPVGMVNRNILLENMGFKIPCKIVYISDIDMGFKTKVTDYGLNNLLVELYLQINVKNDLISPSSFYEFGESYEMVIASKMIVGRLPIYYGNTLEKSSTILSS